MKDKRIILSLCLAFAVCVLATVPAWANVKLDDPLGFGSGEVQGVGVVTGVAQKVINSALGIMGSIALIMIVYGGATLLLSAGRSDWVKRGWEIMTWAIIGLITVIVSYILLNFVLKALSGTSDGGTEGGNECRGVEGQDCYATPCGELVPPRQDKGGAGCTDTQPYCCGNLTTFSCTGPDQCQETTSCASLNTDRVKWSDATGTCPAGQKCCSSEEYTCENTPGQDCKDACGANETRVTSGTCPTNKVCCKPNPCQGQTTKSADEREDWYQKGYCEVCWGPKDRDASGFTSTNGWNPNGKTCSVPGRECRECTDLTKGCKSYSGCPR